MLAANNGAHKGDTSKYDAAARSVSFKVMPRLTSEHFRWQRAHIWACDLFVNLHTYLLPARLTHSRKYQQHHLQPRGHAKGQHSFAPRENAAKCRKSRPCSRCAIWKLQSNKVVSFRCTEEMETLVARKIVRAFKGSHEYWLLQQLPARIKAQSDSREFFSFEY